MRVGGQMQNGEIALYWLNANFMPFHPQGWSEYFRVRPLKGEAAFDNSAFQSGAFGAGPFGAGPFGGGAINGGPTNSGPINGGPADGTLSDQGAARQIYSTQQLLTEEFQDALQSDIILGLANAFPNSWVWREADNDADEADEAHTKLVRSSGRAIETLSACEEAARRHHNNPPEFIDDVVLSTSELAEIRAALEALRKAPVRPARDDIEDAKKAADALRKGQSRLRQLFEKSPEILATMAVEECFRQLFGSIIDVLHHLYAWLSVVL